MTTAAIRTEQRVDHGALLSSRIRPDGTLLAEGYPVREGVLVYRRGGETIRELVTAKALADSAGGLARLPLTLEHPTENGVVVPVTPQNVQRYQVGDTDGTVVVEDGGFVRVQFAVRRADALAAVRGGMRELSALYDAQIDPTPGVHPEYGAYDAVQVARAYNSIALTQRGRAGSAARLRADGAELVETIQRADSAPHHEQERSMNARWLPIFLALGISARYDSDDQAADAVTGALKLRADSAATGATALATATARADAAEAKLATMQAAETARADAAERTALDATATALGLDPKAHATLPDLRVAVATKYLGADLTAEKRADASYVRALVDLASQQRADGRRAGNEAWNGTETVPAPEHRADSEKAKRRPTANEQRIAAIEAARKAG